MPKFIVRQRTPKYRSSYSSVMQGLQVSELGTTRGCPPKAHSCHRGLTVGVAHAQTNPKSKSYKPPSRDYSCSTVSIIFRLTQPPGSRPAAKVFGTSRHGSLSFADLLLLYSAIQCSRKQMQTKCTPPWSPFVCMRLLEHLVSKGLLRWELRPPIGYVLENKTEKREGGGRGKGSEKKRWQGKER